MLEGSGDAAVELVQLVQASCGLRKIRLNPALIRTAWLLERRVAIDAAVGHHRNGPMRLEPNGSRVVYVNESMWTRRRR